MTVHLYGHDGEHLGSWYPDDEIQVPRKGDIVWIETDQTPFDRWRVVNVQWSFRNKTIGISKARYISVEVHIKQYSTKPLWRRFVDLFPAASTRSDQ